MPWLSNTKFRGMNSLRRATEIGVGEAADVLNGDQGSSSQAGPMKGYSRFGNQSNATDSITRVYNYVKQDGVEVLLHVRDDGTNYIVEYLNTEDVRNSEDGEWSILEGSLTRSRVISDGSTKPARIDFAPFNDTGSNQLIYGNGMEAMRIWNGATAAIASTTATTIVVSGTATLAQRGFAASGSLVIDGTTYTYSSISGQTFSGVNFTSGVVDSYAEANRNSFSTLFAGGYYAEGQSFTATQSAILTSCKFYLNKQGSPTGSIYAKLYAKTGDSTEEIPTGSPLATSDAFDASTLTTGTSSTNFTLETFTFSGANQYQMEAGTSYVIVLSANVGSGANYVRIGEDDSSPTHAGNSSVSNNETLWAYNSGTDTIFYVYGTVVSEDGAGVAQAVDASTLSAADKGSIILSSQARIFLAGISATPNQVTFSDVGDCTNYTGTNPADGGFEDFPQMNGDITALSYLDDWIIVFSANKIIAFKFVFPSSTTRVTIRKDIADEGCPSYKAVRKFGDQIIYLTPKGGVKRLTQLSSENVFNVDDITSKISPTIKNFVWDDAALEYLRKDRLWIAAGKSDSDQTQNNKAVSMYLTLNQDGGNEINLGIMDWFISDMAIYGGNLHFGAGFSSRNYKGFDGYSKDGGPYVWRRTERVENFGNAWTKKDIKFLAVRGLIGAGTTLNVKVKYGINGSTTAPEMQLVYTDDQEFIVQEPLNTLGGFELGTEPLGGTIEDIEDLNPFSVMFPLPDVVDREMQVEFSTDGSGQRVSIDSFALGSDEADFTSSEEDQTINDLKEIGV